MAGGGDGVRGDGGCWDGAQIAPPSSSLQPIQTALSPRQSHFMPSSPHPSPSLHGWHVSRGG